MTEGGFLIFQNGETLSFGEYVPTDHPKYHEIPGHEKSFINEIVPSMRFKLLCYDYEYDYSISYYHNALLLSQEGVMMIINNQQTMTSPSEVLCYMPLNPTEEQIKSLEENETLQAIEIQKVYSFNSYDFDDHIEYENFKDYINKRRNQAKKN